MKKNLTKLEIGPGNKKISEEWITVGDFKRPGIVDKIAHWGNESLPFDNETFEIVYASHCLEHVPWYQVDYAVSEVYRILKNGGIFEVHVPDLSYIISCYQNKINGDKWQKFNNQEHYVKWFSSRLISYGPTLSNYHKSCFDEEYLSHCLSKAGFNKIEKVTSSLAHQLHGNINLGIRGKK